MKLSVIFKTIPAMNFDNVSDFGIKGKNENILRINIEDGRTHFINFSDVIACVERGEEETE